MKKAITPNRATTDNNEARFTLSKQDLARIQLLKAGETGVSELAILHSCRQLNGRNVVSDLKTKHGILCERETVKTASGQYSIYRLKDRANALKLVGLLKLTAKKRGLKIMEDLEALAQQYPKKVTAN